MWHSLISWEQNNICHIIVKITVILSHENLNALTSELSNGTVRTDLRSALSQYFQGNRNDGKEETWSLSVVNITSDLHQIHLYHQCLVSTLPYGYGNILPANLFMYENLTELKDVKGILFYAIEVLLLRIPSHDETTL